MSWAENLISYRVGKLTIFFHKEDEAWVNKSCQKKCLAYKNWEAFHKSPVPSEQLKGGKNPFAVRCKTVMGGKVVIGVDKKGNESSLCLFSDDSFLK